MGLNTSKLVSTPSKLVSTPSKLVSTLKMGLNMCGGVETHFGVLSPEIQVLRPILGVTTPTLGSQQLHKQVYCVENDTHKGIFHEK